MMPLMIDSKDTIVSLCESSPEQCIHGLGLCLQLSCSIIPENDRELCPSGLDFLLPTVHHPWCLPCKLKRGFSEYSVLRRRRRVSLL